jgi:PEP-CTERM motif-containing protein
MGRLTTGMMFPAVLLLAVSLLPVPAAFGNTVDIVHDGYGAYGAATVWGAGHEGNVAMAGVYMLNKTGSTGIGDTWSNGLIPGFCIELHEPVPQVTHTYNVGMPDDTYNSHIDDVVGSAKANYLRELWDTYYDPAWASGGSYTNQQNSTAEVFAVAIWEIINEDLPTSPLGWDVTVDGTPGSGGFYAENLDSATANKWLHELTGTGGKADLLVFSYGGSQDFLVAVPEPATIVLLGLGGSLGLFGRRRRTALGQRL